MLEGRFLLGDDQYVAGYSFRLFGAEMFRQTGSIPQWNPYLFGGLPFIAAMHGDIFYPTAWLRWVLPVDTAMNLGFAIHLVLAGVTMYLFLRALRVGWGAALVGGLAYELTGIVASLMKPGHDGKLFVSALAPLALLALLRAIRGREPGGYALFALIVGLVHAEPPIPDGVLPARRLRLVGLYLAFFDPERARRGPLAGRARVGAGRGGAGRRARGDSDPAVPRVRPVLAPGRRRAERRLGIRHLATPCPRKSFSPRCCRSSTGFWRSTGDAASSSCTPSTWGRWWWRWPRSASATGRGRD